jgi:hypothetical protein
VEAIVVVKRKIVKVKIQTVMNGMVVKERMRNIVKIREKKQLE